MQFTSIINTKTRSLLLALLLGTGAPAAFAASACDEPSFDADIPDGKSASQEEMDRVYAMVNEFVKKGESFIACAEQNEGRARARRMRDQILDEMESVAAQFNRQLRIFRRNNS